MHPDCILQALSSSVSDHAPLHLSLNAVARPSKRFKFKIFWTKLEGFKDAVKEGWVCDANIVDPFRRLDALLHNTTKHLQSWGKRRVGNVKLQISMAHAVILRFDKAQEVRLLSDGEAWLHKALKLSLLGLASLERTIARQRARV